MAMPVHQQKTFGHIFCQSGKLLLLLLQLQQLLLDGIVLVLDAGEQGVSSS